MALIEWNNSLSIGVSEIDRQHQQLVKMINELNDAMLSGKGREALRTIINGLISYTGTHFSTVERSGRSVHLDHELPEQLAHHAHKRQRQEVRADVYREWGEIGRYTELTQIWAWQRMPSPFFFRVC